MTELIANAPDWATFAKAAQSTGFADAYGLPILEGPVTSGGSWFYNAVGVVYQPTGATTTDVMGNTVPVMAALPGDWVRVRFNGDMSAQLPGLVAAWRAAGITIYQRIIPIDGSPSFWSADDVTPAPAYVDSIGDIA
jgi:hypothetical protein